MGQMTEMSQRKKKPRSYAQANGMYTFVTPWWVASDLQTTTVKNGNTNVLTRGENITNVVRGQKQTQLGSQNILVRFHMIQTINNQTQKRSSVVNLQSGGASCFLKGAYSFWLVCGLPTRRILELLEALPLKCCSSLQTWKTYVSLISTVCKFPVKTLQLESLNTKYERPAPTAARVDKFESK